MRVDEGTHAIEADITDELQELLEVLLCLPWVPRHKGRTQVDPWHFLTHIAQEIIGLGLRHTATHSTEHRVADMLEGDIKVVADILALTHHREDLTGEVRGISVVQAKPLQSLHVGEAL